MKKYPFLAVLAMSMTLLVSGCGTGESKLNRNQEAEEVIQSTDAETSEDEICQNAVETTDDEAKETQEIDSENNVVMQNEEDNHFEETESQLKFLNKYESIDAWKERHMGSVGCIKDKTVLVSVYLDEPDYHWDEDSIQITKNVMKIGYEYLIDTMKNEYETDMTLLYDTDQYSDLFYRIQIEENIPVYVTTEEERKIDDLEDAWIAGLPVEELMEKYEADSIGFLFFVAHEGCSYSSMHFIDDGIATWDESCLLYLRDMYSKTLEYETPAVYAHELLHLYGAEDLYTDADVFSKELYQEAQKKYPDDLMIKTYDTINGKYTIYSDQVKQKVTPITAYLVGAPKVEYPLENEELIKEETSCFSGSTYDRPF